MKEWARRAARRGRKRQFNVDRDTKDFKRNHPLVAHRTPFMRSAYFGHYPQENVPLEKIWLHVQGCAECGLRYDALVREEKDKSARNKKPRR
jgi:hypothetical protein